MDIYNDTALLGASSSHSPLPLALHEFLGYKAPPVTYSYAHSCDISTSTDERTPSSAVLQRGFAPLRSREDGVKVVGVSRQKQAPQIISAQLGDRLEDGCGQEASDQLPKGSGFVSVSLPSPPNWQAMRSQVGPNKNDKEKRAAWIHGWSASVGELGGDTYCACPDMPAPPGSNPSPLRTSKGKKLLSAKNKITKSGSRERGDEAAGIVVESEHTSLVFPPLADDSEKTTSISSTEQSSNPPSSLVCRTCSRLPSPAIPPMGHSTYFFQGSNNRIVSKGKGILKNMLEKIKNRSPGRKPSAATQGVTQSILVSAAAAPAATTPPVAQQDDEVDKDDDAEGNEDGEIYDINRLSTQSSRKALRPDHGIVARQARLKRAQMLLNKHQSSSAKKKKEEEAQAEAEAEAEAGGGHGEAG